MEIRSPTWQVLGEGGSRWELSLGLCPCPLVPTTGLAHSRCPVLSARQRGKGPSSHSSFSGQDLGTPLPRGPVLGPQHLAIAALGFSWRESLSLFQAHVGCCPALGQGPRPLSSQADIQDILRGVCVCVCVGGRTGEWARASGSQQDGRERVFSPELSTTAVATRTGYLEVVAVSPNGGNTGSRTDAQAARHAGWRIK